MGALGAPPTQLGKEPGGGTGSTIRFTFGPEPRLKVA